MRKKRVTISIFTVIITLLTLSFIITLSSQSEKKFLKDFGYEFNEVRAELGLNRINTKWEHEYYSDLNRVNLNLIQKALRIFNFKNIEGGLSYNVESNNPNISNFGKIIWIDSNALFWKNGISAEMDYYEKKIDSVTSESLYIMYYFRDDNGNKDYFEVNHKINRKNGFFCGTEAYMKREEQRISGEPYKGNISKKEADSILKLWLK